MKLVAISVKSAATIPCGAFSNVRPSLELSATLDPDDDPVVCAEELQRSADRMLMEHAKRLAKLVQEVNR